MISIYQHPTESNPTLGLTFKIFASEEFKVSHRKYENVPTALADLQTIKLDVIIMNLESFYLFCNKSIQPLGQINQEAIVTLRDTVNNALDNRNKYHELLVDVVEKTNFIRVLVKALPQQSKVAGIMMAATIIGYCKDELDEREKNQG